MHWESFYAPPEDIKDNEIMIRDNELRHLSRIMRKKLNDNIWVVDGIGSAYLVELTSISKSMAIGQILEKRQNTGEAEAQVTLFQSILKGDRFDWLVEKATELGVYSIVPIQSQRSKYPTNASKLQRWHRLALAAMKQCGRCRCPIITQPVEFEATMAQVTNLSTALLADDSENSLGVQKKDLNTPGKTRIGLWVGPEGGFSEEEVRLALDSGLNSITLGRRRLRAETAGLVLLTQTMDRLGELGR
ncbi:16S rRNA (uracil(1498)-N(3))-methyltransferase [bacterium]|nr:16S rRNA (uracil(1498)-N(3))-methyltransferase [bacterium]